MPTKRRRIPRCTTKHGGVAQADAQIIYNYLRKLRHRLGGLLTADDIVQAAQNPRSPLHKYFDWNDNIAANNWRLYQARRLLAYLVVVPTNGADQIKALHLVPMPGNTSFKAYTPVEEIAQQPIQRDYVIAEAKREMDRLAARYNAYRHLLTPGIIRILDCIMANIP